MNQEDPPLIPAPPQDSAAPADAITDPDVEQVPLAQAVVTQEKQDNEIICTDGSFEVKHVNVDETPDAVAISKDLGATVSVSKVERGAYGIHAESFSRTSSFKDRSVASKKMLKISLIVIVVVALALGIGLGVGLRPTREKWYKKYPNCAAIWRDTWTKLGNGKCDFALSIDQQAVNHLNVESCGWDDGDCDEWNEKYMNCVPGKHPSTLYEIYTPPKWGLGDGVCQARFNTEACGYDSGDCLEYHKKFPNCANAGPWLGDGTCNQEQNTAECNYDDGDCIDFNREYPGCKAPEPSLVGDGQCNGSAEYVKSPWGNYFNEIDSINPTKGLYNTPECKFDGGDCTEFNKNYPNCTVGQPFLIGDGKCEIGFDGIYNSADCKYDGGDCDEFNLFMQEFPNCTVEDSSHVPLLRNGKCDIWNTPECGFDGGDCNEFNQTYKGCHVVDVRKVGDGYCQNIEVDEISGIKYNSEECGWDGGDCTEFNEMYPGCEVEDVRDVGNGKCNVIGEEQKKRLEEEGVLKANTYNVMECGWDGGDCTEFNEMYPGCKADHLCVECLGDGECHEHQNTPECKNDGGDCL